MIAQRRKQEIIKLLKKNKTVTVKEIADTFNVTMETIRSDLEYICENNKNIVKVHGGAYYKDLPGNGIPFQLRAKIMINEKKVIAQKCSLLVNSGDIIMFDSSSTCDLIANAIVKREIPVVTITNNLSIITLCGNIPWIKLIAIGGTLDRRVNAFNGNDAIQELSKYHSDLTFLSPTAISQSYGLSDECQEEGEIRKIMVNNTDKVFLAVDTTKFDKTKIFKISDFTKVDTVISDKPLTNSWAKFFNDNKIKTLTN